MIGPEHETKEATEIETKEPSQMSTSGGPPEQAQDAPDLSALGVKEGAGQAVKVKGLHAYYGTQHAIKGIDIDFPANDVGPAWTLYAWEPSA